MTNFDADTLSVLRDVQEVPIRTERHPKSADLGGGGGRLRLEPHSPRLRLLASRLFRRSL